jgi:glyoxylase-like metal-dependent hydrolase (beta-lactamase superfamily II)
MNPRITRHPNGITAVDTEYLYPGHAAAHIIQDGRQAAFVDVGTNYSVPYLLAALDVLGIARENVNYVFLTHVHLDHAGGAGVLVRALPNATPSRRSAHDRPREAHRGVESGVWR